MPIEVTDLSRFDDQDAIEEYDKAPPTSETVKDFQRIVSSVAKASTKQGVTELDWIGKRIEHLAVCERAGTIFELNREQAKEAILYGKLNEIMLTKVPYCIIDNHGAVLITPPMVLSKEMIGIDLFIYLNAGMGPGVPHSQHDEHFLTDARIGMTNVEGGPQDSRHFVGPSDYKAVIYRDGRVYGLPDYQRGPIVKDIIQSLTVALDQTFYIRDNLHHPAFNVPIHTIQPTDKFKGSGN